MNDTHHPMRRNQVEQIVQGAIQQTKQRIRERVEEEGQKIVNEEVGKMLADLKINFETSMGTFDGNWQLNLVVSTGGKAT